MQAHVALCGPDDSSLTAARHNVYYLVDEMGMCCFLLRHAKVLLKCWFPGSRAVIVHSMHITTGFSFLSTESIVLVKCRGLRFHLLCCTLQSLFTCVSTSIHGKRMNKCKVHMIGSSFSTVGPVCHSSAASTAAPNEATQIFGF